MVVANWKLTANIVAVFFLDFLVLLFIFTFISLLSFYKYLFRLVRGKILFVLEHVVHNFLAISLKKTAFRV